jgi:hypothetical protein
MDLLDLLERYNMVNTVITPTRETNNTKSLIDMMIIYRARYQIPSSMYELGLSDHHAQTLLIKTRESINTPIKNWKRHINESGISNFSNSLNNISWEEVYAASDVNSKFEIFLNTFMLLFNKAFPLKLVNSRKPTKSMWISNGIKTSSQRIKLFNKIKNHVSLSYNTRIYFAKYKRIYKCVLTEAKKRDNDKFLIQASNKPKAIRQVINKTFGKSTTSKPISSINFGSKVIKNPKEITELFNSHFCETPVKLLSKSKLKGDKAIDQHPASN